MSENEGRSLEYGGDYIQEDPVDPELTKRAVRLSKFVETEDYKDVLFVIDKMISPYRQEIPTKDVQKQAYEVFNILRDFSLQLQYELQLQAHNGKQILRGGTKQ